MKNISLSIVCVLMMLLSGCQLTDMPDLDKAESYLEEQPKEALALLTDINRNTLATTLSRARYSLLYSMALDKNCIDTNNVSVIMPAVEYYCKYGTFNDQIKTQYYLGRIQYNGEHYPDAIMSFTKALDILDKSDDYKYCGLINQAIADTYTATYNNDEAIHYMDEAYSYFVKSGDKSLADLTLYTKALALTPLGKYEEADSLFGVIINRGNLPKYVLPDALCGYAISLISTLDKDTDRIEELFSKAVDMTDTLQNPNVLGAYAYILAKNGKSDISEHILEQLEDDAVLYFWKSRIYALHSDYKTAYSLLKKTLAWQDTVVNVKLRQSVIKAQRDYFALQEANNKITIRNQKLLFLVITLLFILIVAAVILFFKKRHDKIQMEKSKLIVTADLIRNKLENEKTRRIWEQHRFNQELKDKEQTLSMLKSEYNHRYKAQFRQLGTLCETFLRSDSDQDAYKAVYDKVKEMIMDINGDKEGQEHFEKTINGGLNDVMKHFRKDFPTYSEEDYRFVSYIIAGFDATTISVILRMPSLASVYMKKSRIKKQILASDSEYKDQYLELFT